MQTDAEIRRKPGPGRVNRLEKSGAGMYNSSGKNYLRRKPGEK